LSSLGDARRGPLVVAGPVWLAEVMAHEIPTVLLIEREERGRAARAIRRARRNGLPLHAVMGRDELPLPRGTIPAMVIEGAADLEAAEANAWVEALVPALTPGGRLIAVDVTDDPAREAQLSASFLAGSLLGIEQTRPRENVVLTLGSAPPAVVREARFPRAPAPAPQLRAAGSVAG